MAQSACCVLTGGEYPCSELIRLVHSESYGWCVDSKGTLPGQSCWILPSSLQIKRHGEKILSVDPLVLIDLLDHYLLERVQQTLSRARRAGAFCIGEVRIRQWWQQHSGSAEAFLLQAHDGGSAKLWRFLETQGRRADDASLSQSELGLAFQRRVLGSVLVSNQGLCQILRQECPKLTRLRTG